jgi:hypothetical protein
MRRIDVIAIGLGVFLAGGVLFVVLQQVGFDDINAGLWTQAILVGGLIGWLLSYVFRAVTGNMTYHQQLKDYEDAVLQKRLDDMSPEELASLQRELEQSEQIESSSASHD